MDLQRLGATFRAVRVRRGWRQADVAVEAKVPPTTVSRIERGRAGDLDLRDLEAVASALEIRLDLTARWQGGDLDRLLSAGHSALVEDVGGLLALLPSWNAAYEVTFSVFGERGSIDVLAWHPPSRALLVVEVKTEIIDVGALVAQVDRYRRLAPGIGHDRGWDPAVVGCWVVVAESSTNRRRVASHERVLRTTFPASMVEMRRWLRDPRWAISALSFLPYGHGPGSMRRVAAVKRVRRRRTAVDDASPCTRSAVRGTGSSAITRGSAAESAKVARATR